MCGCVVLADLHNMACHPPSLDADMEQPRLDLASTRPAGAVAFYQMPPWPGVHSGADGPTGTFVGLKIRTC